MQLAKAIRTESAQQLYRLNLIREENSGGVNNLEIQFTRVFTGVHYKWPPTPMI